MLGRPYREDLLDEGQIAFLRDHLDELESMFADDERAPELRRKVREHARRRMRQ